VSAYFNIVLCVHLMFIDRAALVRNETVINQQEIYYSYRYSNLTVRTR